MKRNVLWGILGAEAVVCILFQILSASFAGAFSYILAFPFEQIGAGLRALSLAGVAGNAAAIALYAAVCLLPAAALLLLRKKRKLYREEGLLVLLSVLLFIVLYSMINPAIIADLAGGAAGIPAGKAVLGGICYSVFCGYLVLRALRLFTLGTTEKLARYMAVLLSLLAALFVYMACGARFGGLLNSIAALREGNTGNEHLLGTSYAFLGLQYLVDVLPYVLDICVIGAAIRLLSAFRADRYSAETVAAAARVSRLCIVALAASVLSNIGFNLLQLLFAKLLLVINGSAEIPLLSIAFILASLLLTRFIAENKQLKDENDSFV